MPAPDFWRSPRLRAAGFQRVYSRNDLDREQFGHAQEVIRARDHLRRNVRADHHACGTKRRSGMYGDQPGPTRHVDHPFARLYSNLSRHESDRGNVPAPSPDARSIQPCSPGVLRQ